MRVPEPVFEKAVRSLGGALVAEWWLSAPQPALRGRVPADVVKTVDGAQEVERVLDLIESGDSY